MTRYLTLFCLTMLTACLEDAERHPQSTSTSSDSDPPSEIATCAELKDKVSSIAILGEHVGCPDVGESCTWDTECCCGECYPTELCECTTDGWTCQVRDSVCGNGTCEDASTTSPPAPKVEAGVDAASSECGPIPKYVDLTEIECCCGCCFLSQFCECEDGEWVCSYSDACLQLSDVCFPETDTSSSMTVGPSDAGVRADASLGRTSVPDFSPLGDDAGLCDFWSLKW